MGMLRQGREALSQAGQLAAQLAESGRHRGLCHPQIQDQRQELLLGAIVQITLDPPPGLIRRCSYRERLVPPAACSPPSRLPTRPANAPTLLRPSRACTAVSMRPR